METAIKKIGEKACTGCFGCYNVCPVNAIKMKLDKEGFYKPEILDNCVECGKCQNGCPVVRYDKINRYIKSYAAWSNEKDIVLNSSSGGIFSELALKIFLDKGIVYGAAWENGQVKHKRIDKEKYLESIRGSKYIPSNIGFTYREIIEDLNHGKKVLFCGTPCQVAALKKIVNNNNLITVDFICHGIPSYKAYEKYCIEEFKEKIKKVDFRNKMKGWKDYYLVYFGKKKKIFHHNLDMFFNGFMENIYLNKSCYNCRFKGNKCGNERVADITLGDFWGIPQELFNKDGVSFIVINNEKGMTLFNEIKSSITYREVSLNVGLKENSCFYNSCNEPKERELFYKNIDDMSFKNLSNKYFKMPNLLLFLIKRIVRRLRIINK